MLETGADVNAISGRQARNALQTASLKGHQKIVERLLEAGADVDALGGCGDTALLTASQIGHEKIVEMLLKAELMSMRRAGSII